MSRSEGPTTAPAGRPDVPQVYACIARVSSDLATVGVAKSRTNTQQGYKFRGIDDIYNALAPLMAKHGLVIIPRILRRDVVERATSRGGVLFYVTIEAEYDFVAVADGSRHVARTYGEAMDSADKATNKAMSAAYKYVTFQAFCIPTEGDHDADQTTPDVVARAPEGFEEWVLDLEAVATTGTVALQEAWRASSAELRKHLLAAHKDRWEAIKSAAAAVTPGGPSRAA